MRSVSLAMCTTLAAALIACGENTATNTGNPGTGDSPEGIELVRSSLERAKAVLGEDETAEFGASSRDFALDLYAQIRADDGNLFLSPYSISTALAMLYAGAAGETKAEMTSALHFDLPEPDLHEAFNATDRALSGRADEVVPSEMGGKDQGFEISVVNGAFGAKGQEFAKPYLDTLARHYDTGVYAADFKHDTEGVRTAINDWVLEHTNDRIEDLLPEGSLDEDTVLALVNAIYFKAAWLSPFDAARTKPATFHAPDGDVDVEMMDDTGEPKMFAQGDGYRALSLPYVSPDVAMVFILPDEGRFEEIEAGLDRAFLDSVLQGLSAFQLTDMRIPRFEFEDETDLKPVLQALGMELAFSESADLSGITGVPELMVDQVFHKAFVAVNEEGTEAAAATAVTAVPGSLPPPGTFVADRPFLFLVYDEPTGQVLFLGRVLDPS